MYINFERRAARASRRHTGVLLDLAQMSPTWDAIVQKTVLRVVETFAEKQGYTPLEAHNDEVELEKQDGGNGPAYEDEFGVTDFGGRFAEREAEEGNWVICVEAENIPADAISEAQKEAFHTSSLGAGLLAPWPPPWLIDQDYRGRRLDRGVWRSPGGWTATSFQQADARAWATSRCTSAALFRPSPQGELWPGRQPRTRMPRFREYLEEVARRFETDMSGDMAAVRASAVETAERHDAAARADALDLNDLHDAMRGVEGGEGSAMEEID